MWLKKLQHVASSIYGSKKALNCLKLLGLVSFNFVLKKQNVRYMRVVTDHQKLRNFPFQNEKIQKLAHKYTNKLFSQKSTS